MGEVICVLVEIGQMRTGTIKKLVDDRGFGFIETDHGDLFFHVSALQGVAFEELQVGQPVEYTDVEGPKGRRAETVKVVE